MIVPEPPPAAACAMCVRPLVWLYHARSERWLSFATDPDDRYTIHVHQCRRDRTDTDWRNIRPVPPEKLRAGARPSTCASARSCRCPSPASSRSRTCVRASPRSPCTTPIPHIVIKYRVADENITRTVGFGETETTTVSSSLSPWSVWIVLDDEGSHKFLVTRHRYVEPKGCQTASPSPSVSPSESPEPQLPVTGRDLSVPIGLAGGATALLTAIGVVALVRRRRSAA